VRLRLCVWLCVWLCVGVSVCTCVHVRVCTCTVALSQLQSASGSAGPTLPISCDQPSRRAGRHREVDDGAARGVEQVRALLHLGELGRADQVVRLGAPVCASAGAIRPLECRRVPPEGRTGLSGFTSAAALL
jgi:hypothetical protein